MKNMEKFWFLSAYYHTKHIATIMAIHWIKLNVMNSSCTEGMILTGTHCTFLVLLVMMTFFKRCSSGFFFNRLVFTTAHGYHCAPTPILFQETARSETSITKPPTSRGVVGSVAPPPSGAPPSPKHSIISV